MLPKRREREAVVATNAQATKDEERAATTDKAIKRTMRPKPPVRIKESKSPLLHKPKATATKVRKRTTASAIITALNVTREAPETYKHNIYA